MDGTVRKSVFQFFLTLSASWLPGGERLSSAFPLCHAGSVLIEIIIN